MLNVIIDDNESETTQYICKLLRSYPVGDVVTNLNDHGVYTVYPVDLNRVYIVNIVSNVGLYACDPESRMYQRVVYDRKTMSMLDMLCRSGSILILDRPDREVEARAINALYEIILCISETFDEVWVVTNCVDMIECEHVNCFVIRSGELVQLTNEEAHKILEEV